jgi:ABC-type Na+ efflux pump permease subunit
VVSGGAASPDARGAMALQPPGERRVGDYFSFPSAALLEPLFHKQGMMRSVPGLLYASTWADGHAQLLEPGREGPLLRAEAVLAIGGLLPTGLGLFGLVRVLRDRERRRQWAGPLVLLGLLALAFVRYTWVFPQYAAVKASYFLPALLPLTYVLAAGIEPVRGGLRSLLRTGLAALTAGSVGVLWYAPWS